MRSTDGHDRDHKRAILYARVSTDEQAKKGYSIPDQLATLRAYAVGQGYEVIEECVDDGWSGADPDRPGLRRVMELAQTGRTEVVVAMKRDRFFRSRPWAFRGRYSGSSTRKGSTESGGTTAGRLRPCAYHSGVVATARGSRSARSPSTSGYPSPFPPREYRERT